MHKKNPEEHIFMPPSRTHHPQSRRVIPSAIVDESVWRAYTIMAETLGDGHHAVRAFARQSGEYVRSVITSRLDQRREDTNSYLALAHHYTMVRAAVRTQSQADAGAFPPDESLIKDLAGLVVQEMYRRAMGEKTDRKK